jgi:hypothetical protein
LLKEINKLFSVKGVLTAPYSPNQFIERYVQESKRLLKVLNEDFDDFNEESIEQYLRLLEHIMNNRTINTLGASPFSLFYGRKFNMNVPETKEMKLLSHFRIWPTNDFEIPIGSVVFTNKGEVKIKQLLTPTHAGPFTVVRKKENLMYELKPLYGSNKTFVTPLQNIKIVDKDILSKLKFTEVDHKTVQSKRYTQYKFLNENIWLDEENDFTADPEDEEIQEEEDISN